MQTKNYMNQIHTDMHRHPQCPVCGAPIEGEKCEYCGCVIYDFANIDLEHPSYVKFKWNGMYLTMKAIAINPSIEISSDQIDIMNEGNKINQFYASRTVVVNLQLQAIEENGELFKVIKPEKWYRASYEDDIAAAGEG